MTLVFVRSVTVLLIVVLMSYFLSPVAEALNTHSIELNGIDQYLYVSPIVPSNTLDITTSFTAEAWVKLSSLPNNQAYTIASHNNQGITSESQWAFYIYNDGSTTLTKSSV